MLKSHWPHALSDGLAGRAPTRRLSAASLTFFFTIVMKSSSTERGLRFCSSSSYDLDVVGPPAGQFLVAQGVDVELRLGDLLGLGPFGGLEVHDGDFVGVDLRRTRSMRPTTDTPSPR